MGTVADGGESVGVDRPDPRTAEQEPIGDEHFGTFKVLGLLMLGFGLVVAGLAVWLGPFSHLNGPGLGRAWQTILVDVYALTFFGLVAAAILATAGVKGFRLYGHRWKWFRTGSTIMFLTMLLAYLTIRLSPGLGDVNTRWIFWLTLPAAVVMHVGSWHFTGERLEAVAEGHSDD